MNAATLLPDWRAGGRAVTTAHEHPGGSGRSTRCATGTASSSSFVDAGDDGDDDRTIAAFDAAITPDTRLVSISHVLWTTGRGHARRARSPRSPTTAARSSSSTARRPPARSRSVSRTSAPTCTRSRPRSGCSDRRGWVRSSSAAAAIDAFTPVARRLLQLRARRTAPATPPGGPTRRRFEASGYHRPSVVGMARSIGWLSMYVGLDFVHRRGTTLAAAAAARLAAIPGVTVLTPAPRDGDAGDVPDRRLAGAGRARRARRRGSSRSRGRSPASTRSGSASASSPRRTSSSGSPRRSSCSPPHARDAAAAPRRWRSWARDDRRGPTRRRSRRVARGRRSAGASSGTRRGRSSGPWRPA